MNKTGKQFVAVAEYQTPDEHPNPNLLLLEIGGVSKESEEDLTYEQKPVQVEQGGFIKAFQGVKVNHINDVEVLRI